jgi:hypothetical protein
MIRDVPYLLKRRSALLDNDRAVELIEGAIRAEPFCWCGSHTGAVARDGGVWLSCTRLTRPTPRLRRLLSLDLISAHLDRQLLDFADWQAA